jgi:hypothetical protein
MRHVKTSPRALRRHGVTSMLAMMYLVLFSVLAVGFYASIGTSSQVSQNERRRAEALAAAESGMDFMRWQLAQVVIPPTVAEANIITEVHKDLDALMKGTANLGSRTIGLNMGGTQIDIPNGSNEYITLNGTGAKFRVNIHRNARQLVVKVIGCYSNTPKGNADRAAVQLKYATSEHPTDFFDNGMAARGQVTIDTKNSIKGTPEEQAGILTTTSINPPVNMTSGSISGDITVLNGLNPAISSGVSVGGTAVVADILANHVDHMDPLLVPEFPTPDNSIFKTFAVNPYVAGKPVYDNIFIPANTNPTFNSCTLRGVVYVHQPNNVKFNGPVQIQGVIVTENIGVGTLLTNVLTFTGGGNTHGGLETLPDEPQFAVLRTMGGSFVIAPGFDVKFTGNFNGISGNVVGDRVNVQGSADLAIAGSIVALKNTLTLGSNGIISFKPNPTGLHTGLRFSEKYVPMPSSYDEVKP